MLTTNGLFQSIFTKFIIIFFKKRVSDQFYFQKHFAISLFLKLIMFCENIQRKAFSKKFPWDQFFTM